MEVSFGFDGRAVLAVAHTKLCTSPVSASLQPSQAASGFPWWIYVQLQEPACFSGSGYVGIDTLGSKHEPSSILLCSVPLGKAARFGATKPLRPGLGPQDPSVVQMNLLN